MVWAKISLVVVGFPELYQVMLFSLEFFPFFPLLNLLQAIEYISCFKNSCMKFQASEVSVVEERLFLFAAVFSLFSVARPNVMHAKCCT